MATPPVALDELQEFLNASSPDIEAESSIYLSAATDLIETKVGPLVPRDFTETVKVDHCGVALLSNYPVIDIDSLTPDDGADPEADEFGSDYSIGKVVLNRRRLWVTVEYEAGRDPVPDALKLAVMITAGHLWDTQRGNRGGSFGAIYGAGEDTAQGAEASSILLQGFSLPRRAMELIRPYMQKTFR